MEKKPITKEIAAALAKSLPKEAIKPHPTKTFLSTIKAIYVVERFNEVFGIGGWTIRNEIIAREPKEKGGMQIVVKGTFTTKDYDMLPVEQFGGNDNPDLGDAYKGACTDALTKIGSYLGVGMDVYKGLSSPSKTTPKEERAKNKAAYDRGDEPDLGMDSDDFNL